MVMPQEPLSPPRGRSCNPEPMRVYEEQPAAGAAARRRSRRTSTSRNPPHEPRRSRSPPRPQGAHTNEECTPEVWDKRACHRKAGVNAVKRSPPYIIATACPWTPRPTTPDPTSKNPSKRRWERSVQQWRFDLVGITLSLPTGLEQLMDLMDQIELIGLISTYCSWCSGHDVSDTENS